MNPQIEPQHALSPNEIDEIEDRLYEYNSYVTGRHDGQGLGFIIRDELGRMIGVAAGYTWAGTSELKQMWVDKPYRGRGYARALLNAFIAEACSRGVRRIWVASYDFQAPGMYEKAGFKRMAEFKEWPEGHVNVVLCKTFAGQTSSSAQGERIAPIGLADLEGLAAMPIRPHISAARRSDASLCLQLNDLRCRVDDSSRSPSMSACWKYKIDRQSEGKHSADATLESS